MYKLASYYYTLGTNRKNKKTPPTPPTPPTQQLKKGGTGWVYGKKTPPVNRTSLY